MKPKTPEHYHIAVCNDDVYEELVVQHKARKWEVKDWFGVFGKDDQTLAIMNTKRKAFEVALTKLMALHPGSQPVYEVGVDDSLLAKVYKNLKVRGEKNGKVDKEIRRHALCMD